MKNCFEPKAMSITYHIRVYPFVIFPQQVGLFKGHIEVMSVEQSKRYEQEMKGSKDAMYRAKIEKDFLTRTNVIVRVYIIDAYELPPKDADSDSDPYLKIKLGDQVIDDVENKQMDNNHPYFGRRFDLKTTLPGAGELEIEVWDYDLFEANDFIGKTTIDIENRFFSKRFRKLTDIPIETRPLMHPSSSIKQGMIRTFIEIIPSNEASKKPPREIAAKPPAVEFSWPFHHND